MQLRRILSNRWLKIPVFAVCLSPGLLLIWKGFNGGLGANPIEFITHATGDWTLRFLAVTLAVTPLRKLLRLPELVRFRRMLGLFAFFYACLHFMTYLWLDKFFAWSEITKDVVKRPFITAGFTAFVLLIPLSITSTPGWIRRLGGKRWQMIHRLIYVSAVAGVVHYYWLVKSDITRPVFYGAIVGLLLAYRAAVKLSGIRAKPSAKLPGPLPVKETGWRSRANADLKSARAAPAPSSSASPPPSRMNS